MLQSGGGGGSEVAWAQWLHGLCFLLSGGGGVADASERGTKSEVAHKWAQWLHNPCRLGDSRCFRAGDKIRKGLGVALKF